MEPQTFTQGLCYVQLDFTFRLSSGIRWKGNLFGGLLPVESQPETGSLSLPSWNLLRLRSYQLQF